MLAVLAFVRVDTSAIVPVESISFRTMALVRSFLVLANMTTVISSIVRTLVYVLAYGTTLVDFISKRTFAFEGR